MPSGHHTDYTAAYEHKAHSVTVVQTCTSRLHGGRDGEDKCGGWGGERFAQIEVSAGP